MNLFPLPQPLKMLRLQLEASQRERIKHLANVDHHRVEMLVSLARANGYAENIDRLHMEIDVLMNEDTVSGKEARAKGIGALHVEARFVKGPRLQPDMVG